MTGIVGFIIGALCVTAFALTASRAFVSVPARKIQLFSTAFGLFAAAMLLWSVAIIADNPPDTKELMLASDALLLLGSGCMINVLLRQSVVWLNALLGLGGAWLLGLRAYRYPSHAFVHDGLLYFNLSTGVRDVIIALFIACWLPAVMVVAGYTANDRALQGLSRLLEVAFMSLIIVSALFLGARRSTIIIGLFTTIAALFLVMAAINVVIIKLHQALRGAKHGG